MKNGLERREEILGGVPVLKGTRVPVSRVLCLLALGYSIADLVEVHYPFLVPSQVRNALLSLAREVNNDRLP